MYIDTQYHISNISVSALWEKTFNLDQIKELAYTNWESNLTVLFKIASFVRGKIKWGESCTLKEAK